MLVHANSPLSIPPSYLQFGSYPVVSPLGAEYPDNFYVSRTSLTGISSQSDSSWLRYTADAPLPGDWFAAAFTLYDDTRITQKVRCALVCAVLVRSFFLHL